jgi:hypothetical protein
MPIKLTKMEIAALQARDRPYIMYDSEVAGLGVRVGASGAKSWTWEYRAGSGRRAPVRRVTVAKVEVLTPDAARRRANELRALVAFGKNPAQERTEERQSATVAELAKKYMEEEVGVACKPRTVELYESYFRVHVVAAIGARRARDVGHSDIAKLHRAIGTRAGPTANRILVLLSGLYSWAERAGEVPKGTNPVKEVTRFREEGRERFLSSEELGRLGDALAGVTVGSRNTCYRAARYGLTRTGLAPVGLHQLLLAPSEIQASALAVFRLMTNSNLVDRWTGKSTDFSPLRTRPT